MRSRLSSVAILTHIILRAEDDETLDGGDFLINKISAEKLNDHTKNLFTYHVPQCPASTSIHKYYKEEKIYKKKHIKYPNTHSISKF